MSFALKTAIRFLKSDKKQTILIVIGMAIGISVQIFVGLLINSLQAGLVEDTVGRSAHITIESEKEFGDVENYQDWIADIEDIEGINHILAIYEKRSLIIDNDEQIPIVLRGFDLEEGNNIYKFNNEEFKGSEPDQLNEIIIGTVFAEKYNVEINDILNYTVASIIPNYVNFTVTGIFDLGAAPLNEGLILTNRETTENYFSQGNNFTSIIIQVEDVFLADEIKLEIENTLTQDLSGVVIYNWQEINADLLSALEAQGFSSTIIQVFVLMSVVIAIASILAITVLQKSKQVGILKAMGTDDGKASKIFLWESGILGTLGTITGIGLAIFMIYGFSMGSGVLTITYDWVFIIVSSIITIISSLIAGIIPARKSKKLNIIEIIREG